MPAVPNKKPEPKAKPGPTKKRSIGIKTDSGGRPVMDSGGRPVVKEET